jgi:hypothetical protein
MPILTGSMARIEPGRVSLSVLVSRKEDEDGH